MAFVDKRLSKKIAYGATGGPRANVEIVGLTSGFEDRNQVWKHMRRYYDISYGVKTYDYLYEELLEFYLAVGGPRDYFPWKDIFDFTSTSPQAGTGKRGRAIPPISSDDQFLTHVSGSNFRRWQLEKRYVVVPESGRSLIYRRPITLPVVDTVKIRVGTSQSGNLLMNRQEGKLWGISGTLHTSRGFSAFDPIPVSPGETYMITAADNPVGSSGNPYFVLLTGPGPYPIPTIDNTQTVTEVRETDITGWNNFMYTIPAGGSGGRAGRVPSFLVLTAASSTVDPSPSVIKAGNVNELTRVDSSPADISQFSVSRPGGIITLGAPLPLGAGIKSGFEFDVPVRFNNMQLDFNAAHPEHGELDGIELVEVRV